MTGQLLSRANQGSDDSGRSKGGVLRLARLNNFGLAKNFFEVGNNRSFVIECLLSGGYKRNDVALSIGISGANLNGEMPGVDAIAWFNCMRFLERRRIQDRSVPAIAITDVPAVSVMIEGQMIAREPGIVGIREIVISRAA